MSRELTRRIVATVIVLIAAALLVPPFINVNRYRLRMTEALSRATGRPVTIGKVELRLIPQPGFDMENVEIGDDPAISNEPILRADRVTAYLRLGSLWRGRLEIAKLNLQYPSLNLVRGADGHWNVESLLWRASRTPVAPTGQKHAETRVRFPYVAVDQGRVNFKFGLEKHVFAFTDADFSLFSPAENQWRMRIEAKPVRTDTNISDTGTVKADINVQRAEMLRDTAIRGKIAWERGQLGMISKLIYGRDRGWRGTLSMESELSGTPAELHFTTAVGVQDFRRYDIYANDSLALAVTCKGIASLSASAVQGFSCVMPTSPGTLTVSGSYGVPDKTYDISVAGENVGANSVVNLARHVKKDIPGDLSASGAVNLAATFSRTSTDIASRRWEGTGSTTALTLKSGLLKEPILLKPINIDLKAPGEAGPALVAKPEVGPKKVSAKAGAATKKTASGAKLAGAKAAAASKASDGKAAKTEVAELPGEFLTVSPFALPLGAKAPTMVAMRVGTVGYELKISGPGDMEHIIGIARAAGISVPKVTLRGDVAMDLSVTGTFAGLPQPSVYGSATVTDGQAEVPGIASAVLVTKSDVGFYGNEFLLRSMQGRVGELKFTGSAKLPRHCEADTSCGPLLDLDFDELDLGQLNGLLNPKAKKQPWYKLFGSSSEESLLTKIYAVGRVTAKKATIDKLVATRFYADFRLNKGNLLVSDVSGEVLGGTHYGLWQADFTGASPVYSGSGTVTRINVAQAGALTKAPIGGGFASGRYDVKMSGWNADELAKSADGHATFDWSSPTIRAFTVNARGPAKVSDFLGKLNYKNRVLEFTESKMATANGIYSVTGTAEAEKLALELKSDTAASYKVTGSLRSPEVATMGADSNTQAKKPKTEASLKP